MKEINSVTSAKRFKSVFASSERKGRKEKMMKNKKKFISKINERKANII